MSTDQRLDRYFTGRATTVELRPGDPTEIVARAGARRRRRRTIGTGVTALALVAAAVGVQQAGGGDGAGSQVASQPGFAPATPLEWTSVRPTVGLAWTDSTAVTTDGTMYGLSSAPGRYQPDDSPARRVLYRSSDGVEWQTVDIPADLFPSQLAAHGDQLYAVGTAPAGGGGRALVLAQAGPEGTWEQVDLPIDLAALEQAYGRVGVSELDVAVGDAGAVATVTLMAWPDPTSFLPADVDPSAGWTWGAEGLEIYAPVCESVDAGVTVPKDEAARAGVAEKELCREPAPRNREPVALYTWDELGIDQRLRSLIQGELHVFTSVDGSTFTEADVPAGARSSASVAATDSGYVLVTTNWREPQSKVFRSADGRTWTPDPAVALEGYVIATGSIGGRAAIATNSVEATLVLYTEQDGGWSAIDLTAAVDVPAGSRAWGGLAQFGPLGLAGMVSVSDPTGSGIGTNYIVFVDERGISTVPVASIAGREASPISVRVSADAVTVALADPDDDPTDDVPPTLQLLVGTPAG